MVTFCRKKHYKLLLLLGLLTSCSGPKIVVNTHNVNFQVIDVYAPFIDGSVDNIDCKDIEEAKLSILLIDKLEECDIIISFLKCRRKQRNEF